jgi:hypothetical protein
VTGRARRWALAFAAWTVLVWATRIDNIWSDGDLTTAGKLGRTALAISFAAPATLLLVAAWQRRRVVTRVLTRALGVWTVAVWLVRAGGIVTDDHDTAFVVVHLVLAVVSTALAWMAVQSQATTSESGQRKPESRHVTG